MLEPHLSCICTAHNELLTKTIF
uniref:Uncharacterized protein n=1 Tax=Anguilla anguilla TaxID=7936 RepID=A0A0E9QIU3_ANGAN